MATSTMKQLVIAMLMVAVQDVSTVEGSGVVDSTCKGLSQLGEPCLDGAGLCKMVDEPGQSRRVVCVVDCGHPGNLTDGDVDVSAGTEAQDVATYNCDTGYTLNGDTTRTCLSTGVWDSTAPTCSPTDCGQPSLANGIVDIPAGTGFQDSITYSCNSGYVMSATGTCLADGSWGVVLTCTTVDCGFPDAPGNGSVDVPDGTQHPDVATYSCDTEFTLNGDATRTCLSTGDWDGTVPTCSPTALVACVAKSVTANMQNVALFRQVCMSSQQSATQGGYKATDGDLSTVGTNCAHTLDEYPSHITVDLGEDVDIYAIFILNRDGFYAYRLNNWKLQLAKDATPGVFEDVMFHDGQVGDDCFFYLPTGSIGRYVRFTRYGILTICEIEVYTLSVV